MRIYKLLAGKRLSIAAFSSSIIVTLWLFFIFYLRNYVPINVLSLPFDDELFVRRADVILNGDLFSFMSGYNPLVKGVSYPWLLVLSQVLNINPLIFTLFLLVIGVYLIAFSIFSKKQIVLVNLTVFITFLDPFFLRGPASRIARESLYSAALLLTLGFMLLFIKYLNQKRMSKLTVIFLAFLSGLFLFIAQNTREERSWIFLSVLIFLILVIFALKDKAKKNIFLVVLFSSIFLASYFTFMYSLKIFHDSIYNVKLTSTTIEGEFPRLLSNLSSIDSGEPEVQYVSITAAKRKIAYEISPTFKLLEQYLEGPGGMWIQFGCDNAQICDDYANSIFHVALREAIKNEGYWQTQNQAQEYMSQVNSELEAACSTNSISCTRVLPLAKGLGVTKITITQIVDSLTFFVQYINLSINNWDLNTSLETINLSFQENFYYSEINNESWAIWGNVINNLPSNQEKYKAIYNYKTGKLLGPLELWNYLYSFMLKIGLASLVFLNLVIIVKRNSNSINRHLLLISNAMLLVWLTRGLILSLNSTTNLISISEYYSLPGRIFLSIAIALAYVNLIEIAKVRLRLNII